MTEMILVPLDEWERLEEISKLLTTCPKGTTVRAGKTYEDFQFELCQKDKEIQRLRTALENIEGLSPILRQSFSDAQFIARNALKEQPL